MNRLPEMVANTTSLRLLMDSYGLDYLVISDHTNLSWLIGKGRAYVSHCFDQGVARAVITPDEVILIPSNIEADRLQREEFSDLPCRVTAFPWWEGLPAYLNELLPIEARVGIDSRLPWQGETTYVVHEIARLRARLSLEAQQRARALGKTVGEVISGVCREIQQGETEYEIAGRVMGALYARGIEAPVALVGADERMHRWRHFMPTDLRVEKYVCVAVCGRRSGLIVSCSRLVHFGAPPEEIARRIEIVASIDAETISPLSKSERRWGCSEGRRSWCDKRDRSK